MSVRVVLTAAHCVQGRAPGSLMVRLGEWDASATTEALPTQANLQITKKKREISRDCFYNVRAWQHSAMNYNLT